MECVFMDDFERSQSYQCLLMAVIQVDGHVSIINTCHICIKDPCGKFSEFLFIRHPIKESGITGNSQDFAVQAFNIPACFGWVYTLHRTVGKCIIAESDIPVLIIIRNDIRQFGTAVGSSCATGSRVAHSGIRSSFTTCMVERFTFHIYFRGMRLPVHCQTRQQPRRLSIRQVRIYFRPFLQFIENIFRPFFFFNQLPCFLLSRRSSQYPRMCLRHLFRQRNLLSGCNVQKR